MTTTAVEERYRIAPQLRHYEQNEPYLRPYLTFTARPNLRTPVFSTDAEGYRLSASPGGVVDSASWLAGGGGGLVVGGSWTFGVGATADAATLPSQLAFLTGTPQLNLGICTSNSLQNLISAIPFLEAATTIVYCSNATTLLTSLQTLGLNDVYGPIRFESMLAALGAGALAEMVQRALSRASDWTTKLQIPRGTRTSAEADEAELDARLEDALRRMLRDLRMLWRCRPPGARVLCCLQPFADPTARDFTPEERELHDLNAERRGAGTGLRKFVLSRWDAYRRRLEADCAAQGIPFLDLPAASFAGWSFMDEWHMTDAGYRQAAERIAGALS
ncbi:MAG TPA: SGNH/GDSL hydrolase family protein [Candidatus Dormibacteraeota bacterium]|nr:SGNH/GDSL hydrolase family protein [Candidatus Dormibacteraeota bacterium]